MGSTPNVLQAVPFFAVSDIQASVRYYIDGLGFVMTRQWIDEGQLRWCWLQLDEAALMLQQFTSGINARPAGSKVGEGVTICFVCKDAIAIYHAVTSRGISATVPFVGNNLWVTSLSDPDGYRLDFESPTDVPEETVYSPS